MVVTWAVRLAAAIYATMLFSLASLIEQQGPVDSWWPIVLDLIAGSLLFLVFAYWSRTRVVYTVGRGHDGNPADQFAQVRKKVRDLSTAFMVLSAFVVGSAVFGLLLLRSADSTVRGVLETRFTPVDLGVVIFIGAAVGIVGMGLRKLRPFARIAAIALGLLLLSGFPLGTAFAAYTWWIVASPDVKDAFRPNESAMDSPDGMTLAEGEP